MPKNTRRHFIFVLFCLIEWKKEKVRQAAFKWTFILEIKRKTERGDKQCKPF
jgi:hypothetical protein